MNKSKYARFVFLLLIFSVISIGGLKNSQLFASSANSDPTPSIKNNTSDDNSSKITIVGLNGASSALRTIGALGAGKAARLSGSREVKSLISVGGRAAKSSQ